MRNCRKLLLTIGVMCLATLAFAHENVPTVREAYLTGYHRGYEHGTMDYRSGVDWEYNSAELRSGTYNDIRIDHLYRDGYRRGYSDGYSRRPAEPAVTHYVRVSNSPPHFQYVSVFTDAEFSGSFRALQVGRYPDLSGKWNDSIDSIQVHGPVRVILYDQRNFQGQKLILEDDTLDLNELNFGDRAASMIIEPL